MQNVRASAAIALTSVLRDGRSFSGELDSSHLDSRNEAATSDKHTLDSRDIALYRELCFGTLRHFYYLDAVLKPFLRKPLGKKDTDIRALLLMGLYQIIFLRTPDHAALNATVDACKTLKKPWAKGLTNAVLRSYLRTTDTQQKTTEAGLPAIKDAAAQQSHPTWLYEKIQRAWPNQWQSIIDYNNALPPMCLRINLQQCSRDDYQQQLIERDIASHCCAITDTGIILEKPVDVSALPHFDQAWSSVQDAGAQLAAKLLDAQPGDYVLDACAAPGGKAAHLLQHTPNLHLLAMDASATRLERVKQTIERCLAGVNDSNDASIVAEQVQTRRADAAELDTWWQRQPLDKILLDAPCSGSGIISHHPDIKLLRRAADLVSFNTQQRRLLEGLWPALAEGGQLLYCTCSIMPEENADMINCFLAQTPSAVLEPLQVDWGVDTGAGHQLLPNTGKNGGFFYAKISKRTTP